jgi:2-haloacid dehalogenase
MGFGQGAPHDYLRVQAALAMRRSPSPVSPMYHNVFLSKGEAGRAAGFRLCGYVPRHGSPEATIKAFTPIREDAVKLKALTFDIIGTVFDYRDGLAQGVGSLDTKYGLNVQGPAFASGSIAGYANGVAAPGWTPPDTILQNVTASLLPIPQLGPKAAQAIQDFFNLWRALPPWPDVAAGMQALHNRYTLAVLSNMSIATQTALRAHAGLPFDVLLSAETVKAYKPNPAVYQMAVSSLNVSPSEILMVAAHNYDLDAAKGQGMRTAFVARPSEEGNPEPSYDFNATSFIDLAQQLGAQFVTTPDDCLAIDPQNVQVQQVAGSWKIAEGNDWVLDFGSMQADADRAKDVIVHYGFDRICFVGRPHPPMMYFTVKGGAPSGAMAGEDAIAFDLAGVVAQQSGGSWIVTDGTSSLLDFGSSKANALHALTIIKRYGFTHQCFVGHHPNAPMMYFRK